jgi:aryl-alcohol dehydrogenase-like predicted oxidoreductase
VGETFSGVDFEQGIAAAREFSAIAESLGLAPSVAALAWVSQLPGVTTVIPGARNVAQAESNALAGDVLAFGPEVTAAILDIYDRYFRTAVHPRW